MEDVNKILKDLINAINQYNDSLLDKPIIDEESASNELKAYWKAKDIAEEYLKQLS